MSENEPLLKIHDLRTYFFTDEGVIKAVDGVDLQINRFESVGLVGESGCGKSTLALSILRLVPFPGRIVSGEILFNGRNLLTLSEKEMRKIRGGKIGIIFQDPRSSLNPVFNIGSQIAEAVQLHQLVKERNELKKRVVNMLEMVNIPDPERRYFNYPHELSGGMCQRVMIAMALSCKPDLLIADEPTTALDVTIQAQILDLMKRMQSEFKSALLLITHNMGIVAEICEKVAVMYCGKIVEYGDVLSIFTNPRHPYTKALIESIPRVDVKKEELKTIPGSVPSLMNPPPGCRFHPRCSYAQNICMKVDPPKIVVERDHIVFCHRVDALS
ncbi:MAG: ABC transporter ATP-binding protein [archaeon YNP-LCB-003-016]|uniref:ABC transporter ATP-binding protein n=1 Tax=Candidatus Culexarchaeum yellowstonense TaxID=2928963 RepID=UPI0026F11FCE|nr:ABC transporter ATP-binding protein [Candidatus Culexarchaeum yellowstonense]MCR6692081.1 ABC transporter ATP-binding protein [Candidatus Culexarchaeum yellowstonense]